MVAVIGELGILGAIVGSVFSVLFSPLISNHVSKAYQRIGIYDNPSLSIRTTLSSEMYAPGEPVSKYGDLEWKSTYREYSLTIHNKGDIETENIRSELCFPGPVIAFHQSELGGGRFKVSNSSSKKLTRNGKEYTDILHCSKMIWAERLLPNNFLRVDFLVDHKADRNEHLVDLDPEREFTVSYEWVNGGVRFNSDMSAEITGADEIYKSASLGHAISLQESGNFQKSISLLEQALDIDPEFLPAVAKLGIAQVRLGDKKNDLDQIRSGIDSLEYAISLSPMDKELYLEKANSEILLHNRRYNEQETSNSESYSQAVRTLESAIEKFDQFDQGERLLEKISDGTVYISAKGILDQDKSTIGFNVHDGDLATSPEELTLVADYATDDRSSYVRLYHLPTGEFACEFQSPRHHGNCVLDITSTDLDKAEEIEVNWSKPAAELSMKFIDESGTERSVSGRLGPREEGSREFITKYMTDG